MIRRLAQIAFAIGLLTIGVLGHGTGLRWDGSRAGVHGRCDRSTFAAGCECTGAALLRRVHHPAFCPMTLFLLQKFFERTCQD